MFVAARSWPWPELHPPCRQGLTTCLVSRRCRRVSSLPGGGCPRPGLSKVEGFGPQPSTSHHCLIVGVPCTPTGSLRSARASSLAPLRSRQCGKDFVVLWQFGYFVHFRPGYAAVLIDNEDRSFRKSFLLSEHTVLFRDLSMRMEVAEQIVRNRIERLCPRGLCGLGIDADPKHRGSGLFEFRQVRFVAAHLVRTDWRERERMKRKDNVLLSAKIRELHRPALVTTKREIGRLLTCRQHRVPFRVCFYYCSRGPTPARSGRRRFCLHRNVSMAVIRA